MFECRNSEGDCLFDSFGLICETRRDVGEEGVYRGVTGLEDIRGDRVHEVKEGEERGRLVAQKWEGK